MGFTVTQGVNSVILYAVDAYRPIAGEVMVAMLAFKGTVQFVELFRPGHGLITYFV